MATKKKKVQTITFVKGPRAKGRITQFTETTSPSGTITREVRRTGRRTTTRVVSPGPTTLKSVSVPIKVAQAPKSTKASSVPKPKAKPARDIGARAALRLVRQRGFEEGARKIIADSPQAKKVEARLAKEKTVRLTREARGSALVLPGVESVTILPTRTELALSQSLPKEIRRVQAEAVVSSQTLAPSKLAKAVSRFRKVERSIGSKLIPQSVLESERASRRSSEIRQAALKVQARTAPKKATRAVAKLESFGESQFQAERGFTIGVLKELRDKPILTGAETAAFFAGGAVLGTAAKGASAALKAAKLARVASVGGKGLRGVGAIGTGVFIGAEVAGVVSAPPGQRSQELGRRTITDILPAAAFGKGIRAVSKTKIPKAIKSPKAISGSQQKLPQAFKQATFQQSASQARILKARKIRLKDIGRKDLIKTVRAEGRTARAVRARFDARIAREASRQVSRAPSRPVRAVGTEQERILRARQEGLRNLGREDLAREISGATERITALPKSKRPGFGKRGRIRLAAPRLQPPRLSPPSLRLSRLQPSTRQVSRLKPLTLVGQVSGLSRAVRAESRTLTGPVSKVRALTGRDFRAGSRARGRTRDLLGSVTGSALRVRSSSRSSVGPVTDVSSIVQQATDQFNDNISNVLTVGGGALAGVGLLGSSGFPPQRRSGRGFKRGKRFRERFSPSVEAIIRNVRAPRIPKQREIRGFGLRPLVL